EEAKKKCVSGCKSTGGKPCSCSTSGSCLGCKALRGHNDIMSILRHGYVSSYTYKFESYFDPPAKGTYASWNSLCPSGSKCCSNPSCSCPSSCSSSNPSSCDPSQCCPDCPQRKAAKIFLGMLPCLYYGLKILHDRAQAPLTWPDWHDITMDSKGLPSSDLGRFLYAWGYDLRPLISKKGSEFFPLLDSLSTPGVLQKLSTLVTEKYFTSNLISSGSSVPSTVRQMLLWLYGLPFTSGFSSLVSHCSSLCSPFGNSFNSDAFCYYIYTCCFLLPVAIISLIEDSLSITSLHSEFSKFFYPSDPSDLFEKLCEYARKIFVALAFLYYQCERNAGQGGWQFCYYGGSCKKALGNSSGSLSTSVSSASSGCSCQGSKTYLCTAINKDKVHDHCNGNSCLGFSGSSSNSCSAHPKPTSPCTPCPHPLMRFLCDSKPNSDSNSKDYPFGLSGITPMGFSKSNLPTPARKGQDLYHAIYGFCKDGFYPLTRLVQFILCVSRHPPETLGELFGFFKQFVSQLNSKDFKDHFVQWIEDEPGFYSAQNLKKALEDLYGSNSHSTSHSPANLFSLSECHANKGSKATCGPYLHALTENAYNIFIDKFAETYLSWICYRAGNFYSEFKAFYDKAEEKFSSSCSHCKSCQKIVECPCALPFLYSQGFTFHSPSTLNCVDNEGKSKHVGQGHSEGNDKCTTKSCSDFVAQLGEVLKENSPLLKLLSEIDKFLWSIREPFFFFILAFWAFVISYFLYVQLYKLDILELNSHDHPAWSFKIPPSILFSDASSKLKDLSYFTL
ncbi:variant erythrocyte surface antigen-1 family protein, partial [Babesia divergens]